MHAQAKLLHSELVFDSAYTAGHLIGNIRAQCMPRNMYDWCEMRKCIGVVQGLTIVIFLQIYNTLSHLLWKPCLSWYMGPAVHAVCQCAAPRTAIENILTPDGVHLQAFTCLVVRPRRSLDSELQRDLRCGVSIAALYYQHAKQPRKQFGVVLT